MAAMCSGGGCSPRMFPKLVRAEVQRHQCGRNAGQSPPRPSRFKPNLCALGSREKGVRVQEGTEEAWRRRSSLAHPPRSPGEELGRRPHLRWPSLSKRAAED